MEASTDLNKMLQQPPTRKGGLRTMPFIIANEAFQRVASIGLLPNMIFYLMRGYGMDVKTGSTVLSMWSAATNFLPLAGAFLSDTYLGRFKTIAAGCIVSLLGMILLWLTTMIPQARPAACQLGSTNCESATAAQRSLLYSSFALISIGGGGIIPCSLAFGAEQIDRKGDPQNGRVLQTFFNWYYASSAVSVVAAFTIIVYIQDHLGWKLGFGIPVLLMLLSAIMFFLASSIYVKAKPNKSLFAGFAYTTVASFRNRHVVLPPRNTRGCYLQREGSDIVAPSERLRFLNKACLVINREKELKPDGSTSNPWKLCTIDQVEELKALLKVMPIWSTGIILSMTMSSPFTVLQINVMDRHVTPSFEIPPGSFAMFTIASLTIWVVIYDRLVIPLLANLTGRPYGIGLKPRMGIGLFLSCLSVVVAAIVESYRRKVAIQQGFIDNPSGVMHMSAMWLVPQHIIAGLAEAFNSVGQTEFYYSEFPKSMSSIATCLFGLGMAFGNLIIGLLVNVIDGATKKGGKVSWVASNLNRAHYDYYYWIIAILSFINLVYFIICSWAYGPCEREKSKVEDEGEGTKEEHLSNSTELKMITSA